jgi:alkanesulfonate monooxygenase SsuD/methylene tetrahydromethanopterin reductase-like flavin-dependent oxidoreductase (luciferase family)
MPPFRFLADAREIVPGRELAERARRAEGMGYHALVIPDHLLDQLSPLVAMTAVAAATSTLRVGAFVLNNDLRHPAVLAQDLAAIDVISDGRLDVAIGAGWISCLLLSLRTHVLNVKTNTSNTTNRVGTVAT